MKSKFKFWAYFVTFLTVCFSVILIMDFTGKMLNPTTPLAFYLLFSLFFSLVWIWLVFGELRTKVISIDLKFDSLNVKRYLGLGKSESYYFEAIDGYKTSILSSNSGIYEYIYLMIGNKKVVKLSEYYHKNYEELKRFVINQNLKYLGFETFSYVKEFKEIFV